MNPGAAYIWRQISNHLLLFFTARARAYVTTETVKFLSWDEAITCTGPCVVIPIDIPAPVQIEAPFTVSFNDTELTFWNPLPAPASSGWESIPNEVNPVWHRHSSGTLIPAWNFYANLFDLLTFQEEIKYDKRDVHGRFMGSYSPRHQNKLLEVPAFNEAVAALVAACTGLIVNGHPLFELNDMLLPAGIILSHDCDSLYGNDKWTQGVRAYRVVRPLANARLPVPGNLWWMIKNAVTPRRYYFDNLTGMIDLERTFGYQSTFYMLNGSGGRFGARSGTKGLRELLAKIPEGWDTGIHYNYDTHLDTERFKNQFDELRQFTGTDIVAGRAHYLRFDPVRSFPFLESFGIRVDESAGYSDYLGYRCGIGGCFEPFDSKTGRAHRIIEIPMIIMDSTLVLQYEDDALDKVRRMLTHLQHVGGALSVLFHPGVFHNPEFPEMLGIYHRILQECRHINARSLTAGQLLSALRGR